jgi:hypothetical protein
MSSSKSTTAPAGRRSAQQAPAQAKQGQANPNNLDQTITRAQQGRVNVSPEKAVQMAAKLYSEGKYGQAEQVSRQIIEARPEMRTPTTFSA